MRNMWNSRKEKKWKMIPDSFDSSSQKRQQKSKQQKNSHFHSEIFHFSCKEFSQKRNFFFFLSLLLIWLFTSLLIRCYHQHPLIFLHLLLYFPPCVPGKNGTDTDTHSKLIIINIILCERMKWCTKKVNDGKKEEKI